MRAQPVIHGGTKCPEFLQRKGLVVPSGTAQTSLSQPAPLKAMDHSALNHSQRKTELIDAYNAYERMQMIVHVWCLCIVKYQLWSNQGHQKTEQLYNK